MPQLDPEEILKIAQTVSQIYGEASDKIVGIIAKRLASDIDSKDWVAIKNGEINLLLDEAKRIVATLQDNGQQALLTALTDAYETGAKNAVQELGLTLTPQINRQAVLALANETVIMTTESYRSILRTTADIYRQVISQTSAIETVTGVSTQTNAAKTALKRFAGEGIKGFTDRAGRRWELESYVEMATRTSVGRAMTESRTEIYQREGHHLVVVSNSPDECDVCRPYEGKLLSLNGEDVGSTFGKFKVVATLRDAQSKGFHHPNCTHSITPFIAGLTEPETVTSNPEGYKQRVKQRELERKIRRAKKEVAIDEAFGDASKSKTKLRSAQAEMRQFIDDTGRERQRYRERINTAR